MKHDWASPLFNPDDEARCTNCRTGSWSKEAKQPCPKGGGK
jgi:hypothetical protein